MTKIIKSRPFDETREWASYEKVVEEMQNTLVYDLTDLDFIRWFTMSCEGLVFFLYRRKAFVIWDGRIFTEDIQERDSRKIVEEIIRYYFSLHEKIALSGEMDDTTYDYTVFQYRKKFLKKTMIASILEGATHEKPLHAEISDFDDAYPYLINCQNGIVDLRTTELLPHDPQYMQMQITEVNYTALPHGKRFKEVAPNCYKLLYDMFGSTEKHQYTDDEVLNRVSSFGRQLAYFLTGESDERSLSILRGETASGKSRLGNILMEILGSYGAIVQSSVFMDTKKHESRNDIYSLIGKRFVLAVESDKYDRLDTKTLKSLTSTEHITARALFKEFETFNFSGKMFLITNWAPAFTVDTAMTRRINFYRSFFTCPKDQDDKDFGKKLTSEKEAFFSILVADAKNYYSEKKLKTAASFEISKRAYIMRHMESSKVFINAFIRRHEVDLLTDIYTTGNGMFFTPGETIFNLYKIFCKVNNLRPVSRKHFGSCMIETGFTEDNGYRRKINNKWSYYINPSFLNNCTAKVNEKEFESFLIDYEVHEN